MTFQRARTKENRQMRREKILNAAMKVFCQYGYERTTIQLISEKAGVATGTFYLYFPGKLDVFKTLLLQGICELKEKFMAIQESNSLSAEEGPAVLLEKYIYAYIDFYRDNPEYFQILIVINLPHKEMRERESELSSMIDEQSREVLSFVREAIDEGIQHQVFRPCSSWKTAATLWAMLDGILIMSERLNLKSMEIEVPEMLSHSVNLFLKGLENTKNSESFR